MPDEAADSRRCRVISARDPVPYGEGQAWQKREVGEVIAGGEDRLLLLEHKPVLTLGRQGTLDNLLIPQAELDRQGIELFWVERGGNITYHGPGQLVGYPIFNLARHGRDVHLFLRQIEEAGLRVLSSFGLQGRRDPAYTGVWCGEEKVMAIGVAVRRWVSYHGFALNIQPNLAHFSLINPCGIKGKGVTSLAMLLGRPVARAEVEPQVIAEFGRIFGLEMETRS